MVKGFLINLQFFTSIPVSLQLPMDDKHLNKAIQAFPLLGLFQGIVYAAAFYFLQEASPLSSLAAAFLVWLLTIVLTGGIHLDGWIDASDAFFSYRDQERRLEIMKDPRTGAFGVLSVIVLLSSRFLFIYEITLRAAPFSYVLIAAIPLLSKSAMGYFLLKIRAAKPDGLAYLFQKAAKRGSLTAYPLYAAGYLLLLWLFCRDVFVSGTVLAAVAITAIIVGQKAVVKWFGGVTGDVVGAAVEGTELMLWTALWLLHYYAMG